MLKELADCKDEIHSCSKCGLCQSVCPIYKMTGNDCTVSRGQFIMLQGIIKGELKMSDTINRYLNLCLKCGACSKFCPSGIDVVDIIALAKAEYFKQHRIEKLKSGLLKMFITGLTILKRIKPKYRSKKFDKKVIYFDGCADGVNINENKYIVKLLNSLGVEVITPNFDCCGIPFLVRGDVESFREYIKKFYAVLEKYEVRDIVTNCATCGKVLKSYPKWYKGEEISVKNIFDYINESGQELALKKKTRVTFHKPCNLENYAIVKQILENTKDLDYEEMKDYDRCCGFEGLLNFKERKIMSKLFKAKRENIIKSDAKTVLTSCAACKITLELMSLGKYKVYDCIEFLAKNLK